MKPYYEDGAVTIYHGDCREILPSLGSVDLVLTDPPYNVGIEYGSGTDDVRPDYAAWCAEWFGHCRALAPVVALTPGVANVALWCRISEPTWTLAWHKPAAMGRCVLGFNNWEPILMWGKPQGVPANNDVVTAPVVSDAAVEGHPCPKPLKWATGSIVRLCPVDGTVLDPFAGSGTTLRGAKDMGRRAIGIEVEERYCEIAVKRLAQDVLDLGVAA
jgi:hypothetical protein